MTEQAPGAAAADGTSLAGRAAVVTSGTTGIGLAIARALAWRGARVLVFGRHEAELSQALDAIRAEGGPEAHGLRADAARTEDVRSAPSG